MERLIPDEDARREVEAQLPQLPLTFYETPVALPDNWCDTPGAFVLLSESYRQDAATAASMGWPTIERLGTHLDVVNHPDRVAQTLTEFLTPT
jgi:hypothetical protein